MSIVFPIFYAPQFFAGTFYPTMNKVPDMLFSLSGHNEPGELHHSFFVLDGRVGRVVW